MCRETNNNDDTTYGGILKVETDKIYLNRLNRKISQRQQYGMMWQDIRQSSKGEQDGRC